MRQQAGKQAQREEEKEVLRVNCAEFEELQQKANEAMLIANRIKILNSLMQGECEYTSDGKEIETYPTPGKRMIRLINTIYHSDFNEDDVRDWDLSEYGQQLANIVMDAILSVLKKQIEQLQLEFDAL